MFVEEVAALLKEHPENIRRWIREGKLSATKVGRRYDISSEQVHQLKQERDFEAYEEKQQQAVGQVLYANESRIEAALAQVHYWSSFVVEEMNQQGLEAKDRKSENYSKRRLAYETGHSSFNLLIDAVKELMQYEDLSQQLKNMLDEDQQIKETMKSTFK